MLKPSIGVKYNRLTLTEILDERSPDSHVVGNWRCDCGNEKRIIVSRVVRGYTQSCGCISKDTKPNLTHGMHGTATHRSWSSAKDRATNPKGKDWGRYGGAGIGMCDEWVRSFDAFYKDMGEKPLGTSLDRIDVTKGYGPGNCRWATNAQQQQNKKTSFIWIIQGVEFPSSSEAGKYFGVTQQTVSRWVLGYFDERRGALTRKRDDCHRLSRY